MIVHILTTKQERDIRIAYVHSGMHDYKNWFGYRDYVINNIPGVLEAVYLGGDNPDHMESLVFDTTDHLSWFILRWS